MLLELTIKNFVLIEQLQLNFTSGFNVLTGETGAGKSIIIDAITLLIGGRGSTEVVRAGEKSAYVEGTFDLPPLLQDVILPRLEEEGLEGDEDNILILTREIRATGPNHCRVNGRRVSLSLLGQIALPLVDIHGQHHNLRLMQPRQHQALLDRFGGLEAESQALAQAYRKLQKVLRELNHLQQNERELARRIDQLTFQLQDIEAADLHLGEDDELTQERNRLANAEKLSKLGGEAYQILSQSLDEQPSVSDIFGQIVDRLSSLQQTDPRAEPILHLAENISYEIEDLSGQLQDYAAAIEFNPTRLGEVEDRLALIYNLKRKYGHRIEDIIAFGEAAAKELKVISHAEEQIEALQSEVEKLRQSIGRLAATLSIKRQACGQRLARGIETELKSLGMAQTQFVVQLDRVRHPNGVYVEDELIACDETGIDKIEFFISPNPGELPKSMAKVASGGEISRLMLALKTVLAQADETPTLIFDEVDQGIGGRVGSIVGRKLWGLTQRGRHQILCITHLPQIAAYGDQHFQVAKQVKGQRTHTRLSQLKGEMRVEELAQMLGALTDSTRLSAQELLTEAAHHQGDVSPDTLEQ